MNEQRLREHLRRAPVDERARARALRVVRAAYADHEPPSRRWAPLLVAAACLLVAVVVAASATAPGDAVARWVRGVLAGDDKPDDARPALVRVPGGGRLLATGAGAWVVSPDGSRRRLGDYAGASWSPRGLYVVVWRGGELRAVEPGGRVRWSLSRSGPIAAARWSPDPGWRVAYVSGDSLRVVAGDGTGDHRLGPARRIAPAWRPDDAHVLAYADRRDRVRVVAVDSGRELWRRPVSGVTELAWSPDGSRLLASTARSWVVLSRDGRVVARRTLPAGFVADDFAWSPDGRLAVVRHSDRRSDVVLAGRLLFTGSGRFGRVAFSPDGRRLLVPWPAADQWLFLSTERRGRIAAVANLRRQFARGPRPGPFPDAVEWCC